MNIIELKEETIEKFADMLGEDYTDDLNREFYRGLGAVDDNDNPIGAIVYELKNYEEETETKSEIMTVICEDDEVRSALMDTYKAAVASEQVTESFFELPDQNSKEFFEKIGFNSIAGEGSIITVSLEDLMKPAVMKGKVPEHIGCIGDLVVRQYRKGVTRFLFMGKKGLLEDLAYLPVNWFETDISAYSEQDGKINGFLLVRKTHAGTLDVKLFIATGPDYIINLISMLRFTVQKAYELYPPETLCVIKRHNEQSRALAKKLIPDAKGEIAISGERKES